VRPILVVIADSTYHDLVGQLLDAIERDAVLAAT
jgi:hypothetical protein